jgi:hypothetical protein
MKPIIFDIKTMKELVYELQRSLSIIQNDRFVVPTIDSNDAQQWYAAITKMLVLIYQFSSDMHLTAIINCMFDDPEMEETIKKLRAWNNGKKSDWIVYVVNVIEPSDQHETLVVIENIERD